MTASYTVRRNALETARTWIVEDSGLSWQGGPHAGHFDFSEIASIRLEYGATRFDAARFLCSVSRFNGWTEQIVSSEYTRFADFIDRRADYVPFVRTLIAATAAANPKCQFVAGSGSGRYWLNIAALMFSALIVALAAVSFGIPLTAVIVTKAIVILFLLPRAIAWIRRNKPRPFDPANIPADVLP
jgi:hypothetical protein